MNIRLLFIDGPVDYFESADDQQSLLADAYVIGAENGPTKAIKDFNELKKLGEDQDLDSVTIITNCSELLNRVEYNKKTKSFDIALYDINSHRFNYLKDIYPKLKRRSDIRKMYMSGLFDEYPEEKLNGKI